MTTKPAAPPDWAAIRRRYVETDAARGAIIRDAGITFAQFHRARIDGGWKRKKPRGVFPIRRGNTEITTSAKHTKPVTSADAAAVDHAPTSPSSVIPASWRSRAAEMAGTHARRRKNGDVASPPDRATASTAASDTSNADAPFVIPPAPTNERELLARFNTLIWLKFLQLEESMKTDLSKKKGAKRASSNDHEREVRAINTLIDNVGKKKEMEVELARNDGTLSDPDLASEAERYRREFTEHLEKILEGQDKR